MIRIDLVLRGSSICTVLDLLKHDFKVFMGYFSIKYVSLDHFKHEFGYLLSANYFLFIE